MDQVSCAKKLILLMTVSLLGAGCASQDSAPQFAARIPMSGGSFRIALEPPAQVDPAFTDDAYEATIGAQIFSGLLRWDDDLNILPDLAYSWKISRDGLSYEFKLRPDAEFHHGRRVTSDDFVYSFTRLLDRSQVPAGIIQDYLVAIEGVDAFLSGEADAVAGLVAVDPQTLRIDLSRPYPSFLHVLAMDQAKVVPRDVIEEVGGDGFGRDPVGTGPFRMASWNDDRIVLVKNPTYFSAAAHLDSLVFVHYPDSLNFQVEEDFLAGKLEARSLRAKEESKLKQHGNYFVVRRPELSLEILGFNVNSPALQDDRVRRAITMSIDREAYLEISGRGFYTPAGLLPPGIPGYSPENKVWEESVETAKELLTEAGYSEDNPLRFDIFTASYSDYARQRDSVMVASLARSYIEPTIRRVSWPELEGSINNHTGDAFFIIWVADLPDPDSFIYTLFATEGQYNMFAYSNARVDSLLNAGRSLVNVPKRLELYREAERLILQDAPCAPLFNFTVSYAFQPYVRGVEMSPFGLSGIPMHKIWLDTTTTETLAHAGF